VCKVEQAMPYPSDYAREPGKKVFLMTKSPLAEPAPVVTVCPFCGSAAIVTTSKFPTAELLIFVRLSPPPSVHSGKVRSLGPRGSPQRRFSLQHGNERRPRQSVA
jgi:hypothetical protein